MEIERELKIQTGSREEYIPHEELAEISRYLINKHKEALTALANAESIEDGMKYITLNS